MAAGRSERLSVTVSLVIVALSCAASAARGATLHAVATGGLTSGFCTSWATACTLQRALGVAASGDKVWVAAGVYYPSSTNTRTDTFLVPPGVAVYGGFAGTESSLSERDPAANVTVLSGDIDGNDTNTDGNFIDETYTDIKGNNSYHVVTMNGTTTAITGTTVLDGFTITGGEANGSSDPNYFGGGLYCNGSGAGHECSPVLAHVAFRGNSTTGTGGAIEDHGLHGTSSPTLTGVTFSGNSAADGGAIDNDGLYGTSSPTLTDVTFDGNSASSNGGAIFNAGNFGTSSPSLTGVTFSDNSAQHGGAIFCDGENSGVSSPRITNVTFNGNRASGHGGAIYGDGLGGTSSPTLTNVSFSGNRAQAGGAVFDEGLSGTSNPVLTNIILWGDTAASEAEIYNDSATATIDHSVLAACPAGATCTSLVTVNPGLGPLQDNGGSTETMALLSGSSAIDTGTNTGCPATDQRGVARPQGSTCDIGAYELDTTPPTLASTSLQTTYVVTGPSSFTVTFSEPAADTGSGGADSVTNPANYLLVEAGANGTFDTQSCKGGVLSDDTQVPVSGVTYDGGTMTATATLVSSLSPGAYRLFVCGTSSITDLAGNKLNGGTDSTFDFAVLAITAIPALSFKGLALLGLLLAAGALALLRRG